MKRTLVKLSRTLIALCVLYAASSLPAMAASKQVYTRNNIFVSQQAGRGNIVYKASYSGWVGLKPPFFILPAGSKVKVGSSRHGFSLITEDGKEIIFEYRRNLPMPREEYIDKITSDKPFSLKGFSATDQKGIKAGKALEGMSKQGVVAALGYPPVHKVLSLDDNVWTYWKDRYRTMIIEFKGGKVATIRQ